MTNPGPHIFAPSGMLALDGEQSRLKSRAEELDILYVFMEW